MEQCNFFSLCIQQHTSLWTIYCVKRPVIIYRKSTKPLWLVSRRVLCSENCKAGSLYIGCCSEIIPVPTRPPSNVTILHHPNVLPGLLSAGTVELLLNRCVTSTVVQCNRNLSLEGAFVALRTNLIAVHPGWFEFCVWLPAELRRNDGLSFHVAQAWIRHEKLRQSLVFLTAW